MGCEIAHSLNAICCKQWLNNIIMIKKYAFRTALLGIGSALSLSLMVPTSLAAPTLESTAEAKENSSTGTLRQGLPGRRLGGGTRGDRNVFTDAYAYLAALVTSDNLAVTTAAQPTLLFSIPDMTSAQNAEFILRDSAGEEVYRTAFMLSGDAGVASLDLSETNAAPLRLGEDYRWYFSIVSESKENHRANDIAVHGNIRRVENAGQPTAAAETLPLEDSLAMARELYQEGDLWHDAAVMLHSLRQAHPNNAAVAAEWDRLVEFAGLSAALQPSSAPVQISLKSL